MISRRHFIAGACCALHVGKAAACVPRRVFLCATPDVVVQRPTPRVRVYGRLWRPVARATPDPRLLWRESDGATPNTGLITLNVAFLNGTSSDHRLVRKTAAEWMSGRLGGRVAFRFDAPVVQSHIRLGFRAGLGNVSEIGRDSLKVQASAHTMNLDDVTPRGIRHEFGHALGLHHEHQHPAAGIIWNKPVVLQYTRSVGWSDAKTEENIFKHFSKDCACIGDPKPDWQSVMVYPFPADWTLNRHASPDNQQISARDRACLEREYRA